MNNNASKHHGRSLFGALFASAGLCLATSPVAQAAPDRLDALHERLGIESPWMGSLNAIINPEDYECPDSTEFTDWIDAEVWDFIIQTSGNEPFDPTVFIELLNLDVLNWPLYYSAFFDNDASDDYIGVDGEHTAKMSKRHQENQAFWDVQSDDILLMGMHGADIADDEKMVPTVYVLFNFFFGEPLSMEEAQEIVDHVQEIISTTVGYDNPLLTLNAFAYWDEGEGEAIFGEGVVIPNKLVLGEGYLEALSDIGLGDVAPSNVHAHEFAHHVQRELGVFEGRGEIPYEDLAEATRHTELMADAFGTYFLAHARGAAYQSKRLTDALRDAYNSGDCYFDDPNHHGTPNQRERSPPVPGKAPCHPFDMGLSKGALERKTSGNAAGMRESPHHRPCTGIGGRVPPLRVDGL